MHYFSRKKNKSLPISRSYHKQSIESTWLLFFIDGHSLEIRAFVDGKVVSGYFDEKNAFIRSVIELSEFASGIFVTENVVPDALLCRYPRNQINCSFSWITKKYDCLKFINKQLVTTTDNDIKLETAMVIDIDPCRPKDISSSDTEIVKALSVANEVLFFFESMNIPAYIGCSGNGFHVILPLTPQQVTPETSQIRKNLLEKLDKKFGVADVTIDLKVFNMARIIKIYGSPARKGESDIKSTRVHRISWIPKTQFHRADSWPVIKDYLDLSKPEQASQAFTNFGFRGGFSKKYDIPNMLAAAGMHFKTKNKGDYTLYELTSCPSDPSHVNEARITQSPSGSVGIKCFHNSCSHINWKWFTQYMRQSRNINVKDFLV